MELGHYCWFLVRVIIPIMMINIGAQNLPNQHLGAEDVVPQNQAELTQDIARDPCPNGAAYWLYAAGICLLVSSILLPCVLCGMTAGVTPLAFPYVVLVITELSCLIWGSLLVFPAYRDWTYDLEEFSEDYCEYQPMMFAFVMLIIKWVFIGLDILIGLHTASEKSESE